VPTEENDPSFVGFGAADWKLENGSQCSSDIYLVTYFQGRVTCPYGQDENGLGPSGTPGCVVPGTCEPVRPGKPPFGQTVPPQCVDRRPADTVYCTCRCADADGGTSGPFCTCPFGMTCSQFIPAAVGEPIAGAYCAKTPAVVQLAGSCKGCDPVSAPCAATPTGSPSGASDASTDSSLPPFPFADAAPPSTTGDAGLCPNDTPCGVPPCTTSTLGVASGDGLAVGVAVGGSRVFWLNNGQDVSGATGTVGYVDRCGAGGMPIATMQKDPSSVAADDRGVCWANLGQTLGGDYQNDGEVWCWDGTSATLVASGLSNPGGVVLDGPNVLWASDARTYPTDTQLVIAPRTGGSPTALYTSHYEGGGSSLAVDTRYAYFPNQNQVIAVDLTNGVASLFAQGTWGFPLLAGNATSVFFQGEPPTLALTPSPLFAVSKATGSMLQLASDCLGRQIAADDRFAYCLGAQGLERVPVAGGTVEALAAGAAVYSLATDGTYVYFLGGSNVERVASP
jgi:hypothetical protein